MRTASLATGVLVVAWSAVALVAQQTSRAPRTADGYRPPTQHGEIHADVARMRRCGVWDEVQQLLPTAAKAWMQEILGVPIADLDAAWLWTHVPEGERRVRRLAVFEGANAAIPAEWADGARGKVEGQDVVERGEHLLAVVGSRLVVEGDRDLLEPALRGEVAGGVPSADQLSLRGARPAALLSFYVDLAAARASEGGFGFLTTGDYPSGDAPMHALFRIVAVGDDEPHLQFEAIVRHGKGAAGAAATEAQARDVIRALGTKPQLRTLAKVLAAGTFTVHDGDLTFTADFGRPRVLIGIALDLTMARFLTVQEMGEMLKRPPEPAEPAKPADK